jgi:hypothetical protein
MMWGLEEGCWSVDSFRYVPTAVPCFAPVADLQNRRHQIAMPFPTICLAEVRLHSPLLPFSLAFRL